MDEKELIRRALMGSQESQQECTEKGIALPCPFCGGDSELHEAEAIPECVKNKKEIPKDARLLRKVFYSSGSVCYEYRRKTFVPRCCKTNCAGRTTRQYRTKEEALVAWNIRPAPPVGRCKDCEFYTVLGHCKVHSQEPDQHDTGAYVEMLPDDFCSYFEPKED